MNHCRLFTFGIIGLFVAVYGSTIKDILIENAKNHDVADDVNSGADRSCVFAQTMAWRECEKIIDCPTTCAGQEDDCTFPYCNIDRQCECRNAFCENARMCYFFRIDCKGNFTCQTDNGNSYCLCG